MFHCSLTRETTRKYSGEVLEKTKTSFDMSDEHVSSFSQDVVEGGVDLGIASVAACTM